MWIKEAIVLAVCPMPPHDTPHYPTYNNPTLSPQCSEAGHRVGIGKKMSAVSVVIFDPRKHSSANFYP